MKTPESALTLQVTPDIISYSSCIAACGQGQRWSDAMNLLDEMKQLQLQRNIIALRMHSNQPKPGGQRELMINFSF